MTKSEIIEKFRLYVDDMTELSTQEESDLFDKIYQEVLSNRPWEFAKREATLVQNPALSYVDLPEDFGFFVQNHNYAGDTDDARSPVVFIGTSYAPYNIVSWSDRRQYRNKSGFAYLDIVNSRLYFTGEIGASNNIEFDYYAALPNIGLEEEPAFPERFHDIIYHGMCVDDFIIQQSDKAKSYAPENKQRYKDYMNSMAYWNANLIMMN